MHHSLICVCAVFSFGERASNVTNYLRADRKTAKTVVFELERELKDVRDQLLLMLSRGRADQTGYQQLLMRRLLLVRQYNAVITRLPFRINTGVDMYGLGRPLAEDWQTYLDEMAASEAERKAQRMREEKEMTDAILAKQGRVMKRPG